jgi:hypothetical protein
MPRWIYRGEFALFTTTVDEDLEIIICLEYLPETVESASSAIYSEDWGPGIGLIGVKFSVRGPGIGLIEVKF